MGSRKKYAVLVMLLVLLAAAIANFLVVNNAYDASLQRLSPPEDSNRTVASATSVSPPQSAGSVADLQTLTYRGPGWRGDVTLNKAADGSYEVTVRASNLKDETVPITSFEIDVRRPDSDKPILMPVFNQKGDGYFTASVQFPGKGDWEVRVIMHRDNQTLEFARRFHIE